MDKINEYLKKNYNEQRFGYLVYPEVTKAVVCKDGYEISIQANEYTYCTPRENKAWPYTHVELGFPNMEDELINDYAEDENYTRTVYGYVPIDIVNKLIEKHGGITE